MPTTKYKLFSVVACATLTVGALAACSDSSTTAATPVSKLAFKTQPTDATPAGTTSGVIAPVSVTVLDQNGNVDTNNPAQVTVSIEAQANSGMYKGALFGTTTVGAVDGVAEFKDLSVTQVGKGYTLKATAGDAEVKSGSFSVKASTDGYLNTAERGAGYEIAYLGDVGRDFHGFIKVYVDQEPNPISKEAFETYSEKGYVQNTPRKAIFDYAKTEGSPSAPPGELTPYEDPQGYTWGLIAEVQNYDWPFNAANYPDMDPVPESGWEAGAFSPTVPDGVVKYTSNNKNQTLMFLAKDEKTGDPLTRYFVTDPWGNKFIMKSANNKNDTVQKVDAAFEAAVLPKGWTKSRETLTQDLFVPPIPGGDLMSTFLEFRDSGDNAYSQVTWGASGTNLAQQIGPPMPIWTGMGGTRANGTPEDDQMYGSVGNDTFYPNTGDDTIDGGGGIDTVHVSGKKADYSVKTDGDVTKLRGPAGAKELTEIRFVKCDDGQIDLTS